MFIVIADRAGEKGKGVNVESLLGLKRTTSVRTVKRARTHMDGLERSRAQCAANDSPGEALELSDRAMVRRGSAEVVYSADERLAAWADPVSLSSSSSLESSAVGGPDITSLVRDQPLP